MAQDATGLGLLATCAATCTRTRCYELQQKSSRRSTTKSRLPGLVMVYAAAGMGRHTSTRHILQLPAIERRWW